MVHKPVSPTDSTDVWGKLTVVLPATYPHPAVHLQAQTMMQQISIQDADYINTATPAVTAYPRTDNSPAILIWQLPDPNDKIPKAAGIPVPGWRKKTSLTTLPTATCTANTDSAPTRPSTSLLLHVLSHATSAHDGMNIYVHAAPYDVQIALQGTIKHQILTMERNILGDILDAISPIITQTCLGDPTEDPESIYLPPDPPPFRHLHIRP